VAYATVDELAAALRVRLTAENTPGLQACLDAAALEINHELDLPARATLPSAAWVFDTSTAAGDPGPGTLRLNKPTAAATSSLYVDDHDADGAIRDLTDITTGDLLVVSDAATDTMWWQFEATGPAAANTGWYTIPVDLDDESTTPLDPAAGERLTGRFLRVTRLSTQRLALANRVNIVRGVEWYKANDAAFGVIGFNDTGTLTAPRDGFNRHAFTLTPLKQGFGVA
jgi:hypothetical protein